MKHLSDAESDTYDPSNQVTGIARRALGRETLEKFPDPLMGQGDVRLKQKPKSSKDC